MPVSNPLLQYQRQAVAAASPAELIDKLYQIGLTAAHRGDAAKTRRVLTELSSALDHERGGEIAVRLHDLYDFALRASAEGDLSAAVSVLSGLRDAWREGVLGAYRAAA